jgi:uncharacterized protein
MLRERSSDSVRKISLDRTELLRALAAIAAAIRADHPEVASVRLFGSVARGDHTGTSDLDIVVVLRGDPHFDPLELARSFYRYFTLPVPVDILVCSEARPVGLAFAEDTLAL